MGIIRLQFVFVWASGSLSGSDYKNNAFILVGVGQLWCCGFRERWGCLWPSVKAARWWHWNLLWPEYSWCFDIAVIKMQGEGKQRDAGGPVEGGWGGRWRRRGLKTIDNQEDKEKDRFYFVHHAILIFCLFKQAQFEPRLSQKSGSWHFLLLYFLHEMNNFLNVSCNFQGFQMTSKNRLCSEDSLSPGVLVRAITSRDCLFVFVCVYTGCMCRLYWECLELVNPYMLVASGLQGWLLSLRCQTALIPECIWVVMPEKKSAFL